MDYVNLREYAALDRMALEKTGSRFWPVCQMAGHDEEGTIICKAHSSPDWGCRSFPWHPLQLVNVDRDDLPRIPVYSFEDTRHLGLPMELEGKAVFVGWAPFSKACPYRFEDVTDSITERERKRVKPAHDPIVTHKMKDTGFAT